MNSKRMQKRQVMVHGKRDQSFFSCLIGQQINYVTIWTSCILRKNICDSIVGTFLDIQGKTKDHVNARYDLQNMGIRKDLHPREIDKGGVQFSVACFSMNAN